MDVKLLCKLESAIQLPLTSTVEFTQFFSSSVSYSTQPFTTKAQRTDARGPQRPSPVCAGALAQQPGGRRDLRTKEVPGPPCPLLGSAPARFPQPRLHLALELWPE